MGLQSVQCVHVHCSVVSTLQYKSCSIYLAHRLTEEQRHKQKMYFFSETLLYIFTMLIQTFMQILTCWQDRSLPFQRSPAWQLHSPLMAVQSPPNQSLDVGVNFTS